MRRLILVVVLLALAGCTPQDRIQFAGYDPFTNSGPCDTTLVGGGTCPGDVVNGYCVTCDR